MISLYHNSVITYFRDKYFQKQDALEFATCDFEDWTEKLNTLVKTKKAAKPVLYFLLIKFPREFDRFLEGLNSLRITIKDYFYPYNIVKCRYLSVNYHDKDLIMEHCILELLAQFVEKEKPWEFESSSREIAKQYEEELYDGEKHSVIWTKLKKAYYFYKYLEEIDSFLDEKKLKRIYREAVMNTVTYREYLWT